jgi:hypothetical protein
VKASRKPLNRALQLIQLRELKGTAILHFSKLQLEIDAVLVHSANGIVHLGPLRLRLFRRYQLPLLLLDCLASISCPRLRNTLSSSLAFSSASTCLFDFNLWRIVVCGVKMDGGQWMCGVHRKVVDLEMWRQNLFQKLRNPSLAR